MFRRLPTNHREELYHVGKIRRFFLAEPWIDVVVTMEAETSLADRDPVLIGRLVVRTDLDPSAFPMEDGGTKVDESKLRGIQELGDLDPGKSGQMKMTLDPGRYVLFCNQPGHFMAGMVATLFVTP